MCPSLNGRRTLRALVSAVTIVAVALVATTTFSETVHAATGRTLSVATWGSDSAAGTVDAPFRTITHALQRLAPGDTLLVRGGTYDERVLLSGSSTPKGTATAPILVTAYPGERPVIRGRLKLSAPDYWTISGINVTWSSANTSSEHMVQFWGGKGWRFTGAEVWGARSYSAINVDNGASDFRLDHLYVHDTYATNNVNQDHLIYVASNNQGGIIERNVLSTSPNGRGVKVGPGSLTSPASDRIEIRYNTFYNNLGPANVQFSGDSSSNLVHHNIMVLPKSGQKSVTTYELTGTGNVAKDNISWSSAGVVAATAGLTDGGGNALVDPMFANASAGDFRPTNPAAAMYGAHAPDDPGSLVSDPTSTTSSTLSSTTSTTSTTSSTLSSTTSTTSTTSPTLSTTTTTTTRSKFSTTHPKKVRR